MATAGCFCGLFANWVFLTLLAIIFALPVIFALSLPTLVPATRIKGCLALAVALPALAYMYAGWRSPRSQDPLQPFVRSSIILSGVVLRPVPCTASGDLRMLVTPRRISFPVDQAIAEPCPLLVVARPLSVTHGDANTVAAGNTADSIGVGDARADDTVTVRGRLTRLLHPDRDLITARCRFLIDDATLSIGPKDSGPDESQLASSDILSNFLAHSTAEELRFAARAWDRIANWQLNAMIESCLVICRQSILSSHVAAIGEARGGLLTSMVLGERATSLPSSMVQTFRNVGLSHILAASGFNLTVVIGMTYWLLRLIFPLGQIPNLFSFATMIVFMALAGPSPSLIRAALMCSLLLLGRIGQRRTAVAATLTVALLLTWLFSPLSLLDVGLQLSYAATGGIILGARQLSDWINRSPSVLAGKIADAVSIATIAQLSVLPVQAFYFCQVGFLFVISNLLVVPVVTPVTILGFVTSLFALLGLILPMAQPAVTLIARLLDWLVALPLAYMLSVTDYLDKIESARLRLGRPELWAIFVYYTLLLVFYCALRRYKLRFPALMLVFAGMTGLAYKPPAPDLTVACFDSSTVVINSHRDCVLAERIGPCSRTLNQERATAESSSIACDRFLNFNAVRALVKLRPDQRGEASLLPSHPSIFSPSISAAPLFAGVVLCQDKAKGIDTLILDGRRPLYLANAHSQDLIAAMQSALIRVLVLRLDLLAEKASDQSLPELLKQANKLVEATGIEFIVLVQSRQQAHELHSLSHRKRLDRNQTDLRIVLSCPEHVQSVLISRNQISRITQDF